IAECVQVFSVQRRGLTVARNKAHYSRQLENTKLIGNIDARENVSWEKDQVQLFLPVLPSSHRPIYREEVLDSAFLKLLCNFLFVASVCICGVPNSTRHQLKLRHSRNRFRNCKTHELCPHLQLRPLTYRAYVRQPQE